MFASRFAHLPASEQNQIVLAGARRVRVHAGIADDEATQKLVAHVEHDQVAAAPVVGPARQGPGY